MTVAQKREIEKHMDWVKNNCQNTNELLGIKFTLDVLGYWAFPAKDGYKIRKK